MNNALATPSSNKGSVSIRPIDNGFEVSRSKENKKLSADGNNFLYDYESVTFAFDTIEQATAKAAELLAE